LNGYHDFARELGQHHTYPMFIVNLWNSAILAIAAGMHHFYGEHFFEKCIHSIFSPVVYIVAFNVAETLMFVFIHGTYITKVAKFNNMHLAPDAIRGSSTASIGSLGLIHSHSEGSKLEKNEIKFFVY
jgi:TMEM192 family